MRRVTSIYRLRHRQHGLDIWSRSFPHHRFLKIVALFVTRPEVMACLADEPTGRQRSNASLIVEVAEPPLAGNGPPFVASNAELRRVEARRGMPARQGPLE